MEIWERRYVMLTRWYDINREMAALEELQQRMRRAFDDQWLGRPLQSGVLGGAASWPRANLYDTGASLTALVLVPGLSGDDLDIQVNGDILTISGERKAAVPEGYRVHRSERGARKFTRSFGLPCAVDPEKTNAKLVDGVLTVTMEKHPESRPKQIAVSAS
jgi:HSP20 family protein